MTEKINMKGLVRSDEPMSCHTSYRIGGPADIYLEPLDEEELGHILALASEEDLSCFILGGGSNILVSDQGIRGLVIGLGNLRHLEIRGHTCRVGAGMAVSDLSEYLCTRGLGGMEHFYALPGSVGGAVWMNARCYDVSFSDVLEEVRVLTPAGESEAVLVRPEDFDYKKSPFQKDRRIIVEAVLRTRRADREDLVRKMAEVRADREKKGHFASPSAGSVFKNNRAFGRPSGALIDSLGLRGYRVGRAMISPHHANFIINTGGAKALEVMAVIRHIQKKVREAYGYELEPEVLPVGAWEDL